MIQVQVRVKLGDQVVTLVQLGNFPWEPEDFIEDGRKGELGEHWPVGGMAHSGRGPRQPGGRREVAGDCDSQRGGGPGGAPGPDTCGEEQGTGASREEMPLAGLPGLFRVPLWEPLHPHVSRSWRCSQGQRNTSPLFSPAPRTSSATRRTELSREGRSALGTSQRTKYSRWGPPARGLWVGRVSRWWIWASKVLGSQTGEGGDEGGVKHVPWVSWPWTFAARPRSDSLLGRVYSWEIGFHLVCLIAVVTAVPLTKCSGWCRLWVVWPHSLTSRPLVRRSHHPWWPHPGPQATRRAGGGPWIPLG